LNLPELLFCVVIYLILQYNTFRFEFVTSYSQVSRTCALQRNRFLFDERLISVRSQSSVSSYSNPSYKNKWNDDNYRKDRSLKKSNKIRVKEIFRSAKEFERKGQWRKASLLLNNILLVDPTDAHSYLALARLEARRQRKGGGSGNQVSEIFSNGTRSCPDSIHLWQAWAVYEESCGNVDEARRLFEEALKIDPYNPYVCHAYGLMIRRSLIDRTSFSPEACLLWERSLEKFSTAALVCTLGEMLIADNQLDRARILYRNHVDKLTNEREKTEVYLAMAWLEERYFSNFVEAEKLLQISLVHSPTSSVAQIALARLKGRAHQRQTTTSVVDDNHVDAKNSISESRAAMRRSLSSACDRIESDVAERQPSDGRIYNAWASLEVKSNRIKEARRILLRGLSRYPRDHSLLQAVGKVEERLGNYSGAKDFYRSSLLVEPSAPALVAFALLELQRPSSKPGVPLEFKEIEQLFEEALMLDPRHGPAYNAYARCVFDHHHCEDRARKIYERGVRANCSDMASIYHGYGRFELSLGNVDRAREILMNGKDHVSLLNVGTDSPHRERASFLSHTLGMLELNFNRPSNASQIFLDGIERYGNSSQLLLGAALCEVKMGNDKTAQTFFERSIMSDEKHSQAWHAWGVMEMRTGNFEKSKLLFESGLKMSPKHGPLWQAYGTLHNRLGNVEKAREIFQKGIRLSPKYVPMYLSWSTMELREENFSAARALIAKALTLDKRNGDVWLVAAQIEELSGNSGLSNLLLRRGIECSPNNAKLYRALGDSLVGQGKIIEAREVLEKGIEVDPLHAPLYHSLAELEARVFNLDGLARLNKKAASIFNANALEPSPRSSEAWGLKIRAGRSRTIPKGITALAQRIVEDEGLETVATNVDSDKFLDEMMSTSILMEEDILVDLLSSESQSHDT
jgi:tetratricopeptide (TPR) repeat protein